MLGKRAIKKLLLLLMLSTHIVGQGFVKVRLPTNYWKKEETSEVSMVGCSLQCSFNFPECRAFSFTSGKCRHGAFNFTQDSPGSPRDRVFLVNEDATTWQLIEEIGVERYQRDFVPPAMAVDNFVYTRTRNQHSYVGSRNRCPFAGGRLIRNLYKPAVWEMMKSLHKGPTWVDIDFNEDFKNSGITNCSNVECNDMLTWEDGTNYSHVPPMECFTTRNQQTYMFLFTFSNCSKDERNLEVYTLEQDFRLNLNSVICQFEL